MHRLAACLVLNSVWQVGAPTQMLGGRARLRLELGLLRHIGDVRPCCAGFYIRLRCCSRLREHIAEQVDLCLPVARQ